ncbi:4'-phosphopantetheinyl transferase family protein [Kineococcus esterisolvens]|uniref:4'-phosphopantetheinyl transferase family protein n=1 Tax=Kineococcus sp. SYSU DK011 TaxID=3383132 RepID=UPI003D7D0DBD
MTGGVTGGVVDDVPGGRSPALATVLPAFARCAERTADVELADVLPQEVQLLGLAGSRERAQSVTVRRCAQEAVAALGASCGVLPRRASGEPGWPPGLVGSLTHCAGYRGAAVARARDALSLGIDAEPHEALSPGLLGLVASPEEAAALRSAPRGVHGDRVLFCAKEAAYKAWWPLTRRWLGMLHVEAELRGEAFTVRVPDASDGEPARLHGRWAVHDGRVLAAVTVPAP